jgi:hypothetical protein
MKADDLTTAVAKYHTTADQSADHLVQIFGWLSLTENLHIAGVGHADSNQPRMDRDGVEARSGFRELTARR